MIIAIIIMVGVWVGGMCLFRWLDRRAYNGGHCPQCGAGLEHFDTDSGGNEGWICRSCDYLVWVGWINTSEEAKDES